MGGEVYGVAHCHNVAVSEVCIHVYVYITAEVVMCEGFTDNSLPEGTLYLVKLPVSFYSFSDHN